MPSPSMLSLRTILHRLAVVLGRVRLNIRNWALARSRKSWAHTFRAGRTSIEREIKRTIKSCDRYLHQAKMTTLVIVDRAKVRGVPC
jgi:hypothetical protein